MAALNLTNYAAALKEMYPRSRVENLTFKNNPLFALMRKNPNMGGTQWKVPLQYEDVAGIGGTFSTAQANKNISRKVAFNLTPVKIYALASIEGLVWRASQGNSKAFLEASRSELDSAFNALRHELGVSGYRDGSGYIGIISSTVTGTTLTLTVRRDVNNFKVGMKIVFGTDGAALRDGGEALEVTAINRSAGSMTVSANLNTIAGLTSADRIYREGNAAGAGSDLMMTGLQGWLPSTAPTAGDSFFGVDRSADSVRLAGNIVSAAGLTVEEAFIRACTEVGEQGGSVTHIFCPFNVWENLALELGAKREYADVEKAGVHFKSLCIYSPEGQVKVMADRNCPATQAYALDLGTWTCYSVGQLPGILDLDRVGAFLRETTADAYELRVGGYPQIGCHAPGHNAVITNLP